MLAEWLMERHGWHDIWFLGSNRPRHGRHRRKGPLNFIRPGACFVGVWTGPQRDLICIKPCTTNQEAEKYLSPPGWTITHAAIRSWLKLKGSVGRG